MTCRFFPPSELSWKKKTVKLIFSTLATIQGLPGNTKEDLINGSDPH